MVQRVSDFDLQGIIEYQRGCLRDKNYTILGRCTNLRLGIDDNAAYFKGDAFRRLSTHTRVAGLQLEWPHLQAPWVGFAKDSQTLLFVDGIKHRPKMRAAIYKRMSLTDSKMPPGFKYNGKDLVQDNERGYVEQDFLDFASGSLTGRTGKGYAVLQPIEQVIVIANVASSRFGGSGTMLNLVGKPTFDGRHVFLMINPFDLEAYLAGGRFEIGSQ